tara:strand:+ start:2929 stop:3234 length:306 start_codon:yes stop_codon:yes gene_type:complete
MSFIIVNHERPPSPKNGAYIESKDDRFVTLYNSVLDTYGVYKVEEDWSFMYWTPPEKYIHPEIDWESIWKEMDYCIKGHFREYLYSETKYGPEISFYKFKL